jgi:hypothetical protein
MVEAATDLSARASNRGGEAGPRARASASRSPLDAALVERSGERAVGYDRDNRFFFEDLAGLGEVGTSNRPCPRALAASASACPRSCGIAGASSLSRNDELERLCRDVRADAIRRTRSPTTSSARLTWAY